MVLILFKDILIVVPLKIEILRSGMTLNYEMMDMGCYPDYHGIGGSNPINCKISLVPDGKTARMGCKGNWSASLRIAKSNPYAIKTKKNKN